MQPGLTFVQPVTGFHVDSVHSIVDFATLGPPDECPHVVGRSTRTLVGVATTKHPAQVARSGLDNQAVT
jgi:hypothetical protein